MIGEFYEKLVLTAVVVAGTHAKGDLQFCHHVTITMVLYKFTYLLTERDFFASVTDLAGCRESWLRDTSTDTRVQGGLMIQPYGQ